MYYLDTRNNHDTSVKTRFLRLTDFYKVNEFCHYSFLNQPYFLTCVNHTKATFESKLLFISSNVTHDPIQNATLH